LGKKSHDIKGIPIITWDKIFQLKKAGGYAYGKWRQHIISFLANIPGSYSMEMVPM